MFIYILTLYLNLETTLILQHNMSPTYHDITIVSKEVSCSSIVLIPLPMLC